jgi:hypothetical protein
MSPLLSLQVEFYFSDANLPTDRKLLKMIRKDAQGYGESKGDGLVGLDSI